jgi:hypothetical protein
MLGNVMAAEIFNELPRATNANGVPIDGAQWFFYASGTTTPQAVYSDATLTTSLGATVTADSGGQFVPIYFDAALSYRGILRTPSGSTLRDIDPINTGVLADLASTASGKGAALVGANDASAGEKYTTVQGFLTYLLSSAGSAIVGFIQAGAGAINRTLQSRLRDTVHAADFGAVVGSASNQATAIQAAIDAMSVLGGGTVILSAGSYTTSTLNLPQDVFLEGQGKYATRLVATSGLNAPLINRAGTSGSVINRGGVSGLAIIGSGKSNTGMIGIKNVYTNRGVFRDIDIFGTYRGMWIENVWQDSLTNIHVHGGGSDQNYQGFYMAPKAATVGVSNAVIATGCMAQGVENVGFRIENGNGSKFTACEASDGVHAWYIGDPSSGTETAEFMHFVNCLGDTTSGHIWRLEKGAATALRRMHFANCWAGNSTGGTGLYVAGASEIPFVGWQIVSTQLHGIHFNQSSRCLVSGSNIRDYNRPAGASNGVHIEDSSIIKVVGCDIYTTTPGTAKGFVEVGTSNNNCLIGSNSRDGWTILGGATTQANNTTA